MPDERYVIDVLVVYFESKANPTFKSSIFTYMYVSKLVKIACACYNFIFTDLHSKLVCLDGKCSLEWPWWVESFKPSDITNIYCERGFCGYTMHSSWESDGGPENIYCLGGYRCLIHKVGLTPHFELSHFRKSPKIPPPPHFRKSPKISPHSF